jgi:hypothetical protein
MNSFSGKRSRRPRVAAKHFILHFPHLHSPYSCPSFVCPLLWGEGEDLGAVGREGIAGGSFCFHSGPNPEFGMTPNEASGRFSFPAIVSCRFRLRCR